MAETVNEYNETDLGNVAPNPRGDYSETGEYEYLDLVAYAGGSYICTKEDGTISGTAPTPGKTTEIWQEVSRPGDLTPEYVAMHDDVVNKAASVAEDAASVAADRVQVEGMKENVAVLQEQTAQDAQLTKEYRESAAGYASAAETSRTAAGESEENIRALVNGFDNHVEEQKQSAQEEITTSRQAAIKAIAAQQVLSVNAVKQEGQNAIDKTNADAEATAADRAAVAEKAATVDGQAAQVAQNAAQVAEDKATAENYMQTAGESKKQALEAAERLKDSVDLVQKNTVDLLGKAPVIIGSVTSNDGTPVEVNDSAELQLQGLRLYGKSKQVTTTGANLFDANDVSKGYVSDDSGSNIVVANSYCSNFITVSAKTKYYLYSGQDGGRWGAFYDSSKTFILGIGPDKYNTVFETPENAAYIRFTVDYNNNNPDFARNVIFAKSTVALPFEPYTGGKPSPSPDYPQEIVSAGEKGSIGVEITGKNLLNEDKYYSAYKQTDGMYKMDNVKLNDIRIIFDSSMVGKTYTASCNLNCPNTISAASLEVNIDGKKKLGNNILTNKSGISKITFTPKTVRDSIKITYGTGSGDIIFSDFQIEAGSFATSYEPYKTPRTTTIPLSNGLPGIPVTTGGNYTDANGKQYICDEINFARGKYVQRVKEIVLDGSDDEVWVYNIRAHRANIILNNGNLGTYDQRGIASMCSNLLWNRNVYPDSNRENGYLINDNTFFVRVAESLALNTEPDFRTWLASNPITLQYVLATPIETDLSEAQIQAYKSLTTFKPTSIISNDANAQMEVEYAADTKAYIDNKLQEIAQALVASASEAE